MTVTEQIEALKKKGNGRIVAREFAMCGYELAYIWQGEEHSKATGFNRWERTGKGI